MRLTQYTEVFDATGPVLTANLDVSRDSETAAAELELRWRGLRDELAETGAPDDVLDRAADAMLQETGESGACGRVVVVTGAGVQLDRLIPGVRPAAVGRWSALPHLMPLVEVEASRVPYVLVLTDRSGVDITVAAAPGSWSESVAGADHPIHKTGAGGWAQRRFQDRVENTWEHNAADVADRVEDLVRSTGAQLLAVAGDVRAMELLEKHLGERGRAVLHRMESGGRAEGTSRDAREHDLATLVGRIADERATDVVTSFLQEQGRADRAASGLAATVEALRNAQVDVLLVPIGWADGRPAWYGPDPTQLAVRAEELRQMGVLDPTQAPTVDVVLRAAVGTDASLVVVPEDRLTMRGEPAALLRWADETTRHD